MTSVEVNHIFLVLLLLTILYFAWMDVALYYKLQSEPGHLLLTQNYLSAKLNQKINHSATQPPPDSSSDLDLAFDAFNPISLKLLMLDHANHYIYYPLGSWIDKDILQLSNKLTFITPDMISWSHVLVACVAGKLLTSEFLSQRRFGVLLFELRSFLDSLDGLVARSRTKQRAMIADPTQWGYWMDGFCDLLGTIFFLIGVLLICQRAMPRKIVTFNVRPLIYYWMPTRLKKNSSLALSDPDQQPFLPVTNDSKIRPIVFRQSTLIVSCLSVLMFFSSCFWNRYMEQYHMLLEMPIKTETASGNAEDFQLDTLRSATFWIIAWSWRLLNPHAIMSVLLASLFFDKGVETFIWCQFLGFLPLLVLIFTSEVHLQATAWKIWYLAH